MSTHTLYVAEALRAYQPFFNTAHPIVTQAGLRMSTLWQAQSNPWCRDYMPVATARGVLVQFRYWPDYLVRSPKYLHTIVEASTITVQPDVPREHSDLIVDGGNVILGPDYAVLTRKVLRENLNRTNRQIMDELSMRLGVSRIVVISDDAADFTGHADGMVRVLGPGAVVMNNYRDIDPYLGRSVRRSLREAGLTVEELPYAPRAMGRAGSAVGCYINYLRHQGRIVVPQFGQPEDEAALRRMQELFPDHRTVALDAMPIARDGGVFNCITWAAVPEWAQPAPGITEPSVK